MSFIAKNNFPVWTFKEKVCQLLVHTSVNFSMAKLYPAFLLYLHEHNPGEIGSLQEIPSD